MSDKVNLSNPAVVQVLKDGYLHKTNPQIAKELGVTVGVVTGMMQRLGLKRPEREKVTTLDGEIWKPCQNHPGYSVSNLGRISDKNGTLLVQTLNGRGYLQVKLYNTEGERKSERVHRLVAAEFIENPQNKREVNHIDGSKLNNRADNLEWCTGSENVQHAVANNLVKRVCGTAHHSAKKSEETVHEICRRLVKGERYAEIEKALGLRKNSVRPIAVK